MSRAVQISKNFLYQTGFYNLELAVELWQSEMSVAVA